MAAGAVSWQPSEGPALGVRALCCRRTLWRSLRWEEVVLGTTLTQDRVLLLSCGAGVSIAARWVSQSLPPPCSRVCSPPAASARPLRLPADTPVPPTPELHPLHAPCGCGSPLPHTHPAALGTECRVSAGRVFWGHLPLQLLGSPAFLGCVPTSACLCSQVTSPPLLGDLLSQDSQLTTCAKSPLSHEVTKK